MAKYAVSVRWELGAQSGYDTVYVDAYEYDAVFVEKVYEAAHELVAVPFFNKHPEFGGHITFKCVILHTMQFYSSQL